MEREVVGGALRARGRGFWWFWRWDMERWTCRWSFGDGVLVGHGVLCLTGVFEWRSVSVISMRFGGCVVCFLLFVLGRVVVYMRCNSIERERVLLDVDKSVDLVGSRR